MQINISEFTEGARKATGVAVIIDVFRAFSVACYAFDSGASRLFATSTLEEAFTLKKKYPRAVLVGERNEKKPEGFDFGNSPTEILKTDLSGKTVIQTTTAGTQGLTSAGNADIVLTGSLVNAYAVVQYINVLKPPVVSLVAMGYRSEKSAEEDLLCATLIKSLLEGKDFNESLVPELRNTSGKRFFDPSHLSFSPPTDFFLCTMIGRFGFVLKAIRLYDGSTELIRIDV